MKKFFQVSNPNLPWCNLRRWGGFALAWGTFLALGCAEGNFPGAAAGGLTLLLLGLVSAGFLLSQGILCGQGTSLVDLQDRPGTSRHLPLLINSTFLSLAHPLDEG